MKVFLSSIVLFALLAVTLTESKELLNLNMNLDDSRDSPLQISLEGSSNSGREPAKLNASTKLRPDEIDIEEEHFADLFRNPGNLNDLQQVLKEGLEAIEEYRAATLADAAFGKRQNQGLVQNSRRWRPFKKFFSKLGKIVASAAVALIFRFKLTF